MRYVLWHVKGVRREVRGAARDAARRSELSVGAWLTSLAGLSSEIKALSDKIDRISRPAADPDLMNTLERRLAEIAQAVGRNRPGEGAPVPANFDAIIKALADRLEAVQISAAGEAVLKSFEQRIGTLVEKLANFDTQSDRRDGADCRMEELLAQLRELRDQNESRLSAIQQQIASSAADIIRNPAQSIRRDVASLKEIQTAVDRRTQDTFEAVHGTIEQVVGRLAVIEDELRDRHFTPHPSGLAGEPEWRSEPCFAPDACLDPDSGARPVRVVANAIDRIAASEAVNGIAQPAETSAPARAKFVAAARRAAQAVVREHRGTLPPPYPPLSPTLPSPPCGGGLGSGAGEGGEGEKPSPDAGQNFLSGALFRRLRPRTKSLVLGVSMVLLMFGA